MNIPICCGEVVQNSASGKDFYYCRGCKQEVTSSLETPLFIKDKSVLTAQYVLHSGIINSSGPVAQTQLFGIPAATAHVWNPNKGDCDRCAMRLIDYFSFPKSCTADMFQTGANKDDLINS